ncbi:hypothetical protein [Nonomuraea fuscirosea]|uniref:hypothetical protein n=1 Tax=Nonomuraea fuscirosea TaxID=1291556 RepID=UPI0033E9A689
MRIAPLQFVTLDGVTQGPGSPDEETRHEATPNGLLLLEYETTGQAAQAAYEGVTAFIGQRS